MTFDAGLTCSREYSTSWQKWVNRRKMGRFLSWHGVWNLLMVAKKRDSPAKLLKVISGGQTGVDRGTLDAALAFEVECGGWCPAGRLAEDGKIPERYPVVEMANGGYAERTAQNVAASDGTLIIAHGPLMGGTRETLQFCIEQGKPHLVVDLHTSAIDEAIA